MKAAFIAAVVDTLLPGDEGGPSMRPPLLAGSAVGIDLRALTDAHLPVFEGIARQVDGPDAFVSGTDATRVAAIQAVECAMPDAFRALLSALLADYYESVLVLLAMGWRTDPPQPWGNTMPAQDPATAERLKRVQARGKVWRE